MSIRRRGPSGKRDAIAQLAVLDVDQFKRAAAEVADNAIGLGNAGDDAKGRVARLFLAASGY